jgi:hypothetical protein
MYGLAASRGIYKIGKGKGEGKAIPLQAWTGT